MKMKMNALKALELKPAEYGKANGAIAEHESCSDVHQRDKKSN